MQCIPDVKWIRPSCAEDDEGLLSLLGINIGYRFPALPAHHLLTGHLTSAQPWAAAYLGGRGVCHTGLVILRSG